MEHEYTPEQLQKINYLVAEKVMGWKHLENDLFDTGNEWKQLSFPTDIAAAWLVVEKMHEDGWYFEINRTKRGSLAYYVYFGGTGYADVLAPLAICIASLIAYGVDVDAELEKE